MKILLDTHILLWALVWDDKLPDDVLTEINNPENEIYYSVASIWELTIKHVKNPKIMPVSGEQLATLCDQFGYLRLPLLNDHIYLLSSLHSDSKAHNDPFDRILICQAKAEEMTFITHDAILSSYNEPCVTVI